LQLFNWLFREQFVIPTRDKHKRLAIIKNKTQGHSESLQSFLTDIGANLNAINYPRNLWLDLIFSSLKPELQQAIKCFAHDATFD
jgi:hypothetical protein